MEKHQTEWFENVFSVAEENERGEEIVNARLKKKIPLYQVAVFSFHFDSGNLLIGFQDGFQLCFRCITALYFAVGEYKVGVPLKPSFSPSSGGFGNRLLHSATCRYLTFLRIQPVC